MSGNSDLDSVSAGSEDESLSDHETSYQSLGESLDAISQITGCTDAAERRVQDEITSQTSFKNQVSTNNEIESVSDANDTLISEMPEGAASSSDMETHDATDAPPVTVDSSQPKKKKKGKKNLTSEDAEPTPDASRSVQSFIDKHFPVSSTEKTVSRKRHERPSPSPKSAVASTREAKSQKTQK